MRVSKAARESLLRDGMKNYAMEASRNAMRGTVLLGSRIRYSGKQVFTVKQIAKIVDDINVLRVVTSRETVPCLISESLLVGRTGDAKYQERLFKLEFSISPRWPAMTQARFYRVLSEYANALGVKLKQTRVYIEFDDNIAVLKAKLR